MTNWLITGAGGGLGQDLAAAALARGDKVVATMRSAEAAAAFSASAPGRALGLVLDLARPENAAAVVAEAESWLGQVDRLVNNAGFGMAGAIEETTLDQIRALFEVNVLGAIAMIQAVLPAMRAARAGHIINVTSMSGWAPWAGTAIYGASKYALECIGQTLAQEVAELGIRVTNVAPGGMRTGFAGKGLVQAARHIADYDGAARFAQHSLAAGVGREKGDPVRAAAAILAALDAPRPPVHLFLGEDSLRHIREHLDEVQAAMAEWEALTLSIAYPEAEATA
ncbi:MAG TPA: oxidoreductase [Novosphingobium sp.]|nr:oxidoreductase [Novosphingobium sp.]HZV10349.1 oxidoreductase [Novosphingobium sp.]